MPPNKLVQPTGFARGRRATLGSKNTMMKPLAVIALVGASAVQASEAPPTMREFNVHCPASKLLPLLDSAYHECNKGLANGSCERFVATFGQLAPEYDCQRSFDATPDKKYVVPAIWLAGDDALEDYIVLLARMASGKDKMFRDESLGEASAAARKLFTSEAFSGVLDGHLAEEYGPLVEELQKGSRD